MTLVGRTVFVRPPDRSTPVPSKIILKTMAESGATAHETMRHKTATEAHPSSPTAPVSMPEQSPHGMWVVRHGVGAIMIIGGIVVLIANPAGLGTDGFAMAAGGGLSVLLINYMYRLSVSSELDRIQEEQARRYFDEHGEWPDDPPPTQRHWTLPAGVVTPGSEEAEHAVRNAG
jgi:hypothetical protein